MTNIINDSTRYIAYICPFCSEICRNTINVFEFSSSEPVELFCTASECGEDCVSILRVRDKFKISIECPACGETHTFKISSKAFLFKNILKFSCPESNISIFFAGMKDLVEDEVSKNHTKISEMSEQFDVMTEEFNVIYRIVDCIHSLLDKERISCYCGSRDVSLDFEAEGIIITCNECGKSIIIEASEENLERIESMDNIQI